MDVAEVISGIEWQVYHDAEGFTGGAHKSGISFYLSLDSYHRGIRLGHVATQTSRGKLTIRQPFANEIYVSGTVGDLLKIAALAARS